MPRPLQLGILGAGRTRNGLGPFVARFAEQAGARVVAVAGRTAGRAAHAADGLAAELGHPVAACTDLEELLAFPGLGGLIVTAPPEAHRPALEAAGAARMPVLCEKPLVLPGELGQVPRLLAPFARDHVPIVENCQWPHVLTAYFRLFPDRRQRPVERAAMGLAPSGIGPAMYVDALPHFLSVLQAVLPVDEHTVAGDAWLDDRAADAERLTVSFVLERPFPAVRCRLELQHAARQPRPAWVALDGHRADRRIAGPGYRILLADGEREEPVDDPLAVHVYGFVRLLRTPDPELQEGERRDLHERSRLYRDILTELA